MTKNSFLYFGEDPAGVDEGSYSQRAPPAPAKTQTGKPLEIIAEEISDASGAAWRQSSTGVRDAAECYPLALLRRPIQPTSLNWRLF
jgi:hypothetical protein